MQCKTMVNIGFKMRYILILAVTFGVQNFSHGKSTETHVEFDAEPMKLARHFHPDYWFEKSERNTSIHYDLWKRADVELLEWPGNITKLDPKYPMLKWTKVRAKYVHNVCSQDHLSMEMVAYAYKYIHLTWGPYRITESYCPPLRIPATVLRALNPTLLKTNATLIPVVDFGFVLDTLLVVTLKGSILRISGLEMAYTMSFKIPGEPLHYSVAKGLTLPVNKLVTQSCCSLSNWCPEGDAVLAYREKSHDETLFISFDGGKLFKVLEVLLPSTSRLVHSAAFYPEQFTVAVLHGNTTWGTVDKYSVNSGRIIVRNVSAERTNLTFQGNAQMSRVGNEQSLLIWDDCSVWYSYNGDNSLEKSLLYINKIVYPNRRKKDSLHKITAEHCHFGDRSSLAISPSGNIGFLDRNNVLFFGMDSKKPTLQLVALKTDMSLLLENKTLSIVPYFDRNNGPKLLYPPRFLRFEDLDSVTKNYSKRAAMRLLIKSLFPSEFITVFFKEQVKSTTIRSKYSLEGCMTSTLTINNSISQKTKVLTMSPTERTFFYLTFKSKSPAMNQLNIEPNSTLKFLNVNTTLMESSQLGLNEEDYWFKYMVNISFRSVQGHRKVFLLNFYTAKELRCNNYQPQQAVWIVKQVGEKPKSPIPIEEVLPPILTDSKERKTCAFESEGVRHSNSNGQVLGAIKMMNKMSKLSSSE